MSAAPTVPPSPAVTSALYLKASAVYSEYQNYSPPSPVMGHVGAEYKGLSPALHSYADAIHYLAENGKSWWPLEGPLPEKLGETHLQLVNIAKKAHEFYRHFLSVHEHDIRRLENPRKGQVGESKWNIFVGVQSDGLGIRSRPSVFQALSYPLAHIYQNVYAPTSMQQVYYEVSAISASTDCISQSVQVLSRPSHDKWPVENSVTEVLTSIAFDLSRVASEASNLVKLFRMHHANDLRKKENPRKGLAGEREWDV